MEQEDEFDGLALGFSGADWRKSDEALAYYLTSVRYGGANLPDSVAEEIERIREAARHDGDLARRIDTLHQRIERLDSGESHYRSQRFTPERDVVRPPSRPDSGGERVLTRSARPGRSMLRQRMLLALLPASMVALLAILLWPRQSPYADLAYPEPSLEVPDGALLLRGNNAQRRSAAVNEYERARALLVEARRGALSLRSHDSALLMEAIRTLHDVREAVRTDDPIYLAATIMLAKAHLAGGDAQTALETLQEVADSPSDTAALVETLETRVRERMNR